MPSSQVHKRYLYIQYCKYIDAHIACFSYNTTIKYYQTDILCRFSTAFCPTLSPISLAGFYVYKFSALVTRVLSEMPVKTCCSK